MNYDKAYSYLTGKLEKELSQSITYHNLSHTKNVIEAAITIGQAENITGDEATLLKTAALFHDAGFLISSSDHETHSCHLAKQYLPGFGYDNIQRAYICELIMTTRMPQSPYNLTSKVLCDADLYYLGQKDYTKQAKNLYQELLAANKISSQGQWIKVQISFLEAHQYFTNTANDNCNAGKLKNLDGLFSKCDQVI